MELQKIAVKFFTDSWPIPLAAFIEVFHGWIQESDGIYYDVADYSHMQAGPGVVLVAQNANLAINEAENRRGLLFMQKGPVQGAPSEVLRRVLHSALENCSRLKRDPRLGGHLEFSGGEILITVNDRLRAPNTDAAFAELKPALDAAARALFRGAAFSADRDRDPRRRLSVVLRAETDFDTDTLLENLRFELPGASP